jgi:hypothetical protein
MDCGAFVLCVYDSGHFCYEWYGGESADRKILLGRVRSSYHCVVTIE